MRTIRWECEIEAIPGFVIRMPEEPVLPGGDGKRLIVWSVFLSAASAESQPLSAWLAWRM
ncbi:hypothetical protein SCLCIDRAFT_1223096 [Scleroderma citrinum Foug A]|uniref:Uncharacterized protein n=1 Tax=Scleroderma citrinum Foug A TaxID=1036808 RepID=A0A0C3DAK2_9AGAM|nr:hypothetical protein SCLCIDRAFT_1223096 [Scleroderma citrinum Foug A]